MQEEPEDSGEDIPSRQLGLELVYHLQVIQFVDNLFTSQSKCKHTDCMVNVVFLQALDYTTTLKKCIPIVYWIPIVVAQGSRTIDDPEVITVLHGLYTMAFSAAARDPLMGRNIMSKVLGFDRNIEVLLPYLERIGM